jgi:hypothetical protein
VVRAIRAMVRVPRAAPLPPTPPPPDEEEEGEEEAESGTGAAMYVVSTPTWLGS